MKLSLFLNILIIMFSKSFNLNLITFNEKKTSFNNYLLYNLYPKYQAECIKILPAPKPIKSKNIDKNHPRGNLCLYNIKK